MTDGYGIWQTLIQGAALLSLIYFAVTYYLDRRWKRTESAYEFYNDFDRNRDCQLAMFMIDYQEGNTPWSFDYDFVKLSRKVHVRYNLQKRKTALTKPYEQLSNEEQVIRFIFDVYIGYLERVFYCISTRYFGENELVFYKYWLDKLISEECGDIRTYALGNSCGLFVPFLGKYRRTLQRKLNQKFNDLNKEPLGKDDSSKAIEETGGTVASGKSLSGETDMILDTVFGGAIAAVIAIYYTKMIEPTNGDYSLKLMLSLLFVIGCFLILKSSFRFTQITSGHAVTTHKPIQEPRRTTVQIGMAAPSVPRSRGLRSSIASIRNQE